LSLVIFTTSCKKLPYEAIAEDIIKLSADPDSIKPGETSTIKVIGIKANGFPMPDQTIVLLTADSGQLENDKGEPIEAVGLVNGEARAVYRAESGFTGDQVSITAQSGEAQIVPEALIITIEQEVVVENQKPTAAFVFSPQNPKSGDAVNFNAEASTDEDGTIVSYNWDFGDGTTGVSTTGPIYTYTYNVTVEKTYVVTLRVVDNDNAEGVVSLEVTVIPEDNQGPKADFTYTPQEPKSGEVVNFTSTSTDKEGAIIKFQWDFGDGGGSEAQHPAHIYIVDVETSFEVSLTVEDDQGAVDTAVKYITVDIGDDQKIPTAAFEFSPQDPKVGDTVYFTSESYHPFGLEIKYHWWNFGDGNKTPADESIKESHPTTTHEYQSDGEFVVRLTIEDELGNTAFTRKNVTVAVGNKSPTASFTFAPASPKSDERVIFDAGESADEDGFIETYIWDFGDGQTSVDTASTHGHRYTVTDTKTFTVTLTVVDDGGATGTTETDVTVTPD
jgi:PKD repeat protein